MKLNQSVQKAAAILRAAALRPDGETASGLARTAGLSHATSLRLIHTLENEGLLMRRPGDGRYLIGLDLLRLATEAEPAELLRAASRKPLKRVADETRETVTLSVLRGREALDVVLQVDTPHMIQAVDWIGRRYPLHASSSGKIVLAALDPARLRRILSRALERHTPATITDPGDLQRELERVRRQGYSVIVDELEEGLASVSVPILGAGRRLLGTVNVTGPSFRFDPARRRAALEHMRLAVAEIETGLGGGD
jgi:DNA-binding IclR family transcriptional regulator